MIFIEMHGIKRRTLPPLCLLQQKCYTTTVEVQMYMKFNILWTPLSLPISEQITFFFIYSKRPVMFAAII